MRRTLTLIVVVMALAGAQRQFPSTAAQTTTATPISTSYQSLRTTPEPTTAQPETPTAFPTTAVPITEAPTTAAYTTAAPTTAAPTTAAPTTAAPTTAAPTTAAPTTAAPTSTVPMTLSTTATPSTAAPSSAYQANTTAATAAPTSAAPPAPCSSELYSLMGKCGGASHAYLRCPKGYWCSQWGYCGTTAEYRKNSLCPREKRDNPAINETQYGFSPDDKPEAYLSQDDMEAEIYDKDKNWKNCRNPNYHRWGKCGTVGHGNFRCKYGEWCSKWGYCSKFEGSAEGALCPRESRRHPKIITYVPTPDDDPKYVEPKTTAKKFRTTKGGKH